MVVPPPMLAPNPTPQDIYTVVNSIAATCHTNDTLLQSQIANGGSRGEDARLLIQHLQTQVDVLRGELDEVKKRLADRPMTMEATW